MENSCSNLIKNIISIKFPKVQLTNLDIYIMEFGHQTFKFGQDVEFDVKG